MTPAQLALSICYIVLCGMQNPSRVEVFEQWLRCMLFELLLSSAHLDEKTDDVWQAAHGVMTHLVCEHGVIAVSRLAGLSNKAARALLEAARRYNWCACLKSSNCLLCQISHDLFLLSCSSRRSNVISIAIG
jgi:hypothetical protein